jgi:hypothetical protein
MESGEVAVQDLVAPGRDAHQALSLSIRRSTVFLSALR